MADVPKDLIAEIKQLEEMFMIDTPKLKQITDHFVEELEKGTTHTAYHVRTVLNSGDAGLSTKGGSIVGCLRPHVTQCESLTTW